MGLVDIGNGLKMFVPDPPPDPIEQQRKALTLLELENRVRSFAAEQEAREAQVEERRLQNEERRTRLTADGVTSALSGDFETATRLVRIGTGNDNLDVLPHTDLKKRNSGVVLIRDNATGVVREQNPYASLGAQKQVETRAALAQKAAEMNLNDKQQRSRFISDKTIELSGKGFSLEQSKAIATQVWDGAHSYEKNVGGVRNLTQKDIQEKGQAAWEIQEFRKAGVDPSISLRDLKPLPDKEGNDLISRHQANNFLTREVLPRYADLHKEFFAQPGILTTPIQNILGKLNASDPRFVALKTLVGQGLFDEINRKSGSAFSDMEYSRRQALFPQLNDTLEQAMAKITALTSLNSANAMSTLAVLESTGHDVRGVRKLFQGRFAGLNSTDITEQTAQAIKTAFPQEYLVDREKKSYLLQGLSPALLPYFQDKKDKARQVQATPPPPAASSGASNVEKFNNLSRFKLNGR